MGRVTRRDVVFSSLACSLLLCPGVGQLVGGRRELGFTFIGLGVGSALIGLGAGLVWMWADALGDAGDIAQFMIVLAVLHGAVSLAANLHAWRMPLPE